MATSRPGFKLDTAIVTWDLKGMKDFPMVLKLLRLLSASIEKGITASFSGVALENETLVDRDPWGAISFSIRKGIKRCIDFTFASLIFVFILPVMILIAIVIRMTTSGPVFYRQERVGYKGKIFRIWKFSTMVQKGTEEEHRQYIQYLLGDGMLADDKVDLLTRYIDFVNEKTTPVGRFLRSTSLDELPQLLNILSGDMSLVGPRPHPVYEVDAYKEWYRRRLEVKPGLTGWSKLNLRCTPRNYEESILYDLWYVDNWSLYLDLRILLMTIPFVIASKEMC